MRGRREGLGQRRRSDDGSRGQRDREKSEDATLLVLKREIGP